jgi:ABC-type antimicrobial peptide transport system permease subunit
VLETDNNNFSRSNYALVYNDEIFWSRNLVPAYTDIEGEYPSKENEIMLPRAFLRQIGITEPEIGMEIFLKYRIAESERSGIFILSGFYTSFEYASWREPTSLQISEAFFNSIRDENKNKDKNDNESEEINLQINAGIIFRSNWNVDRNIMRVRTAVPPPGTLNIQTPMSYNSGAPTEMIIIFGTAILFLMITGFLLIYNALNISISNDVRFFGLLKTVGAAPGQIRRVVMGQAARLCVFAIPPAAGLAVLASLIFVPAVLGIFSDGMELKISFSPYIYTGAPLLTLITAFIGAAAPAAKASRIAPIEAVRYTGENLNKKRARGTARGKPLLMALRNIFFRNKKRMITVFISLFLSLSLFMTVAVITFSMNAEKYMAGLMDGSSFILRYWSGSGTQVSTWPEIWLDWTAEEEDNEAADFQWDFSAEDFDWDDYYNWLNAVWERREQREKEHNIAHGGIYLKKIIFDPMANTLEEAELDFPIFFFGTPQKFDDEYLDKIRELPGFRSMDILTMAHAMMIYNQTFEPYVRANLERIYSAPHYDENGRRILWSEAEIRSQISHALQEPWVSRGFICTIYGVDAARVRAIGNHIVRHPNEFDGFENGEIAFFTSSGHSELLRQIMFADVITSKSVSENLMFNDSIINFKIPGDITGMFGISVAGWSSAPGLIVERSFLEQIADPFIWQVNIQVRERLEQEALLILQELTEHDETVQLMSRIEIRRQLRGIQLFFWIIGGSISGVVGLTGLLNFINVMSVGIMSRRKELAAMESIGMTRKQIRRMLMCEGAGYAVFAILLAGTLGNIIALNLYNFFERIDHHGELFYFSYPYAPFIIAVSVILAVCLATPLIAYRSVNRSTIVERLREIE